MLHNYAAVALSRSKHREAETTGSGRGTQPGPASRPLAPRHGTGMYGSVSQYSLGDGTGFKVQVTDAAGGLRVVGVFSDEAMAKAWIAADQQAAEQKAVGAGTAAPVMPASWPDVSRKLSR